MRHALLFSRVFLLCGCYLFSQIGHPVFYLGELPGSYAPQHVREEMILAGAMVVEISDGLILFGVNEKTRMTPFLREFVRSARVFDTPEKALQILPHGSRSMTVLFARFHETVSSGFPACWTSTRSIMEGTMDEKSQGVFLGPQTVNEEVSGINAMLSPGGMISGRVQDSFGTYVPATVWVYDASKSFSADSYIRNVSTTGEGRYLVGGLPAGSFKVYIIPASTLNCLPMWYGQKASFDNATPVSVSPGTTVFGIDVTPEHGGIIQGSVDTVSSQDKYFYASSQDKYFYASLYDATKQDADSAYIKTIIVRGNRYLDYSFSSLPTGSYKIFFSYPNLLNICPAWYAGKTSFEEATPIGVVAGSSTSVPGVKAVWGADISGSITVPSGWLGHPVSVFAYDSTKPYNPNAYIRVATAIGGGKYFLWGLSNSSYKIYFVPQSGNFLPRWYKDGDSFDSAKPVVYKAYPSSEEANITLALGGILFAIRCRCVKIKDPGLQL